MKEKSEQLEQLCNQVSETLFGKSLTDCIKENICVFCHNKIDMNDFRDVLSKKEYLISGICQKCQDDIFK
jgi:hypothetical protein